MAVLVGAALLLGCAPRESRTAHLTVGTSWGGTAAEALHRELLGIAKELGTVTIDLRTFTASGFNEYLFESQPRSGEETLDLIVVPNDWLGRLAQRRLIAEIPAARIQGLQQMLVRQAILTVSEGEQVLAYPVAAEALALVYDPSRFPSPPVTLDDVLAGARPDSALAFAFDLSNPYHLAPLMTAYQGQLVDEVGSFVWRDDTFVHVIERLRPAWGTPQGWSACRGQDLESLHLQLFVEGRLASFVAGPWLLEPLERSGRPFAVVPIPAFADAPHPARALVGYQCVAASRNSTWADVALEVAERLCDRETNEALNRATRRLPVLLSSYQTQKAMASPGTVGFLRALEEGQLFPAEARWSEGFQRVAERLQRLTARPSPALPSDFGTLLLGGDR
jgi:arabinogalactan oligomer/maltooligosaccharide transport system substrate-binding protein